MRKGELNPFYGKKHDPKFVECMNKMNSIRMTGPNNPMWKGGISYIGRRLRASGKWKKWREKIFKRDNWTCRQCEKRNGNGHYIFLEPHHRVSFAKIMQKNNVLTYNEGIRCKELWDIDNGITLCKDCHNLTKPGRPMRR